MDKAGDILKSFLSFYHLEKGEAFVSFFSRWRELVGDDLASHAKTVDIKKNALIVEVDHPGWMQLLQIRQAEILKSIKKQFPELNIRYLHMKLVKEGPRVYSDPVVEAVTKEEPNFVQPEPAPAETPAPGSLENIKDEEFKNLLVRLGKSIEENSRKPRRP